MDKREQIIEIATKLFSERGYENTALSLVCEKANVSKGLISHHFKSKDGLLREIFLKTTQLIVEINRVDKENQTPSEQLIELLDSLFSKLASDKLFFQFNLNVMVQPNTRKVLDDLIKERSSFILKKTKEIFDKIDIENSLVMSHMFIAELDGISLNYLGIYEDFPLEQIKKEIIKKYALQ
ncbi:TetR/AcrR family transcriptional regulator [Cyclobacterium marinum]|uniref:Transcriptional regulator, TetR family n=1 Tax=Cyclobacterium marinum (strain ATCC 25205 / DSM 745 / LMG 13164 / NCIMB 1802) TaxID=880070 RepID=G0J293_CYCMS|nr:TetR/AcrR family transcriptional regulator [Cyclobacterium marinum]AEL25167.1 transcriptional regulator, TetR family [Cyclobacterium marinum DSM 745]